MTAMNNAICARWAGVAAIAMAGLLAPSRSSRRRAVGARDAPRGRPRRDGSGRQNGHRT